MGSVAISNSFLLFTGDKTRFRVLSRPLSWLACAFPGRLLAPYAGLFSALALWIWLLAFAFVECLETYKEWLVYLIGIVVFLFNMSVKFIAWLALHASIMSTSSAFESSIVEPSLCSFTPFSVASLFKTYAGFVGCCYGLVSRFLGPNWFSN